MCKQQQVNSIQTFICAKQTLYFFFYFETYKSFTFLMIIFESFATTFKLLKKQRELMQFKYYFFHVL